MSPAFIIGSSLLVLVGFSMGLIGAGGSILTIPVLVYVFKIDAHQAVSMSLLSVALAAAAGAVSYIRRRSIHPRLFIIFVLFGSVSSLAGARLSYGVSDRLLMLCFGFLMVSVALPLFFRKFPESADGNLPDCVPKFFRSAVAAVFTGTLTGFLGVGGGFLIVPVLSVLMKCSLQASIGTSLAVIAWNSSAALAGHWMMEPFAWREGLLFAGLMMAGAVAGSRTGSLFSPRVLNRGLALMIFGVGTAMIILNWGR